MKSYRTVTVMVGIAALALILFLYFSSATVPGIEKTGIGGNDGNIRLVDDFGSRNTSDDANTALELTNEGQEKRALFREYTHYIGNASNGDASAQLAVAVILEKCTGVTKESVKRLDEDLKQADVSTDAEMEIREKYQACHLFCEKMGEINFAESRLAWIATAAANNNQIAQLQTLLEYPDQPDTGEIYFVLKQALVTKPENNLEQQKKYELLARFYADYIEPNKIADVEITESNYDRGVDRLAWEYLTCNHNRNCDVDELLSIMDDHYNQFELNEMKARVSQIESAIEAGDTKTLGFD